MMVFTSEYQELLQKKFPEYSMLFYENIGSTQSECQRRWEESQRRWLILANCQTQGRGRYGRNWQSPPNTNIYVSWVQPNPFDNQIATINLWCGVLLYQSIAELYGNFLPELTLKWPNDLYVGNKKLAGILLQSLDPQFQKLIIGIGINVHSQIDQIPNIATSIEIEAQKNDHVSVPKDARFQILQKLLTHFQQSSYTSKEILREFSQYSQLSRKLIFTYSCHQYYHQGTLSEIYEDGSIRIQTLQGESIHLKN